MISCRSLGQDEKKGKVKEGGGKGGGNGKGFKLGAGPR